MPKSLQTLSSGWPKLLLKLSIHFFLFIVYSRSKICLVPFFFFKNVCIYCELFILFMHCFCEFTELSIYPCSLESLSLLIIIILNYFTGNAQIPDGQKISIFWGVSYCKIVVVFGSVMFYLIFCLFINHVFLVPLYKCLHISGSSHLFYLFQSAFIGDRFHLKVATGCKSSGLLRV